MLCSDVQYMFAFVLLKHYHFHEELLFPQCLELSELVIQGGLPFPGQEVVVTRLSYASWTDTGLSLLSS